MKKTTALKKLIESKDLSFLMEAHNGLSAKIVEEAGFKGIWGSGLSISASLGVRDNNEASWTQVLDVVEFMSDATTIPLLLDGDTGYGNFNNMRRLVNKLEQRDIAGVCIEDKIFPKTNSFLRGEVQPLADMDEFCGKIKAGLDSRRDDDFCIVARVEALIAGHGLKEALKRAEAYRQAGATAILMHSKKSNADEIFAFMKEWGNRAPVVIVPTKYYSTPTEQFREHNVSTVIWANHLLRSAIQSMQQTAKTIFTEESLHNVEDKVVAVSEVFRLQNDDELAEAEKKYFQGPNNAKGIILAASRGKELGELTIDRPKALLPINGKPLLVEMVEKMRANGIKDINVIRGHKKEAFPEIGVNYIDNDQFETTGELASLYLAKENIEGDLLISYGDIIYKGYILSILNQNSSEISLIVDSNIEKRAKDYVGDFVNCSRKNFKDVGNDHSLLLETNLCKKEHLSNEAHGEWIGLLRTNSEGSRKLKLALEEMAKDANFNQMKIGDLLNFLVKNDNKIEVDYIDGHWMDVDNFKDFEQIQVF